MRYIPIRHVHPGMRPENNILDSKGNLLLQAGHPITETILYKLFDFGVPGIYIMDSLTSDIKINEAIPFYVRKKALIAISQQDVEGCIDVSKNIVKELDDSDITSIDFIDLNTGDNLTASHSVNVAILSCIIGMSLYMKKSELEGLVTAALLHDIGKYEIAPELLDKPQRLTPAEYAVIKSHPQKGFDMIAENTNISSNIKVAILSHHENVDGSGYPRGTTGEEQSLFAKIIHVADVYDALISKRPFKEPYSPLEASEYLMGGCSILFDQTVVESFIKYIAIYPKGSQIFLSDGRTGFVYNNTDIHNLRPIILMDNGQLLDLASPENLTLGIMNRDDANTSRLMDSEIKRAKMMQEVSIPHILAVDDLKTNLLLIRDILGEEYELTLATSGDKAIEFFLKDLTCDLILMDIDMPGMNGIETAKRIKVLTDNKIPILFVTSLGDLNTVIQCRKIGAAGYVLRPYNSTYIKAEISRILWGGF